MVEATEENSQSDSAWPSDYDSTRRILSDTDYSVERVSYGSPLEIVLTVGTTITVGSATLYLTGRRALDLFHGFQGARRDKAETDVIVKAFEVVEEELTTRLTSEQRLRILQVAPDTITRAANCLDGLSTLEVIEEDEAEIARPRRSSED
jgi:hypothetical protein